jgi:hypothetical protein
LTKVGFESLKKALKYTTKLCLKICKKLHELIKNVFTNYPLALNERTFLEGLTKVDNFNQLLGILKATLKVSLIFEMALVHPRPGLKPRRGNSSFLCKNPHSFSQCLKNADLY